MLTLPPVPPATGWRASIRLARDHYIRLDSNDYSVHPSVIGRRVEVIADLTRIRVLCDGKTVADHQRLWAKHQTVSDPAHVEAAKLLRRKHLNITRDTSRRPRPNAEPDVEIRCLADYDTALGLTALSADEGVA
jgi:hypothetical protein